MKSNKTLWIVIICLFIALAMSVLSNLGIVNISKELSNFRPKKIEKVLQISDVKMTLGRDWKVPKGSAVLILDFVVENISNLPQTLSREELGVFDYKGSLYGASSTFEPNSANPMQFTENINPKIKKELSVAFEVPENELYSFGFIDRIRTVGKQVFFDKIENMKYEYEDWDQMVNIRNKMSDEEIVNLNDYFRTQWNGDIDFNKIAFVSKESAKAFDEELKKKGIYWSKTKEAWVKRKK